MSHSAATNHTPGEWEFRPVVYGHFMGKKGNKPLRPASVIIPKALNGQGDDVMLVCGSDVKDEANARLISSAPELLAALIEARKIMEVIPLLLSNSCKSSPRVDNALAQIDAAISKATQS